MMNQLCLLRYNATHIVRLLNVQVHAAMSVPIVRDYVPGSWVTLVHIKSLYYKGKAHQHVAESLLWFGADTSVSKEDNLRDDDDLGLSNRSLEVLQYLHKTPEEGDSDTILEFTMPTTAKEKTYLGKIPINSY